MRQEVIIIVRNYQLIIGNQIFFFFDGWGKIFKTYKSRRIFLI